MGPKFGFTFVFALTISHFVTLNTASDEVTQPDLDPTPSNENVESERNEEPKNQQDETCNEVTSNPTLDEVSNEKPENQQDETCNEVTPDPALNDASPPSPDFSDVFNSDYREMQAKRAKFIEEKRERIKELLAEVDAEKAEQELDD